MRFPFEKGVTYTIGKLRAFERELLAARQADEALSKEWSEPTKLEMKRWIKIREETYPIKLLADHKAFPEDATFQLTPDGFPEVDAEINSGLERFKLQITIAHPIWAKESSKIQHGGYNNRLLMEALNRDGIVHGLGEFRRDGNKIVCDGPTPTRSASADACRKGLVEALARKAKPNRQSAGRLLIFARAYTMICEGFSQVVEDAIREFEQRSGVSLPFEVTYFVEQDKLEEWVRIQEVKDASI